MSWNSIATEDDWGHNTGWYDPFTGEYYDENHVPVGTILNDRIYGSDGEEEGHIDSYGRVYDKYNRLVAFRDEEGSIRDYKGELFDPFSMNEIYNNRSTPAVVPEESFIGSSDYSSSSDDDSFSFLEKLIASIIVLAILFLPGACKQISSSRSYAKRITPSTEISVAEDKNEISKLAGEISENITYHEVQQNYDSTSTDIVSAVESIINRGNKE